MCGISGVFLRNGEVAAAPDLKRMSDAMFRRGPDADGVYVHRNVGLSHRRLSIIDLSTAANQPMPSASGKLSLVFNGEIYNFREIRAELEALGRSFRTHSDTEVILQAFEEWGPESFRRLNGMFAFGLLDLRGAEPCLYLVRDRFGVKPLFYSLETGRLAFASELKPLMTLPWISRDIENETLFYFLKFSHVSGERSMIRGVRQLSPGCFLKYSAGTSTISRFWDPGELVAKPPVGIRTEDEWCDELDAVLQRVVERQLVSDVPLGCFLSGGIDSSLLVMAHAQLRKPPLKTFTISYAESEFDEAPHAAEVARAFGADHHEFKVGPQDLIRMIPDIPTYFDQPFADPTLLSSLVLARLAREHVTVALSGDGGDELFFGYTYQRALLQGAPLLGVPAGIRRPLFATAETLLSPLGNRTRKAAEILQFENEAELFQYFIGTVGPMRIDRLARLLKEPVDLSRQAFRSVLDEIGDVPWRDRIEQIFVRTFLVDTVLTKTDRTGMAFGLEARVPFLDDEMADFSARLPFKFKYRNGTSKYLLRRLLARRLPGNLSRRGKQGFSIPLRDWLRGDLKYLLDEYLNPHRLRKEGIFAPGEVKGIVDAHLSGRANHSHLLWSLISFQMWKETYLS